MPTIYLVRHGQASFGAANYDVLSGLGRQQARLAARALGDRQVRPAKVVSGRMQRQRETAAAFVDIDGVLTIDPRWDEYDADDILSTHSTTSLRLEGEGFEVDGDDTNRNFHAILESALVKWIAAGDAGGSRSWARFCETGSSALADLGASLAAGETAIVSTSGGVIAALAATLLEAPESAFLPLNRILVNASLTKVAVGSRATLLTYNDHSHLEIAGRAMITFR